MLYIEVAKSEGEGSRGGKVIGHTSSGKPVYEKANHASHKEFSKEDHLDAAHVHHGARARLGDDYNAQKNSDGTISIKHIKKREKILKQINKHREQAERHAAKYEGKSSSPSQRDFDRMDRKNDPQKRSKAWSRKSMTRSANYTVALKDSLANNAYIAGYDAEIASVAVMNGDLLLMGKRRDNGKWTLPGGHLNPGESPHDGGLRELYEEAGIQAHALTTLGQRGILTDQGKFMMIYAYYLPVETKVSTKLDPDEEITEWRWINTANGLPKYVLDNLHATRNFVLNCLGLQKGNIDATFYVEEMMKKSAIGTPRAGHKYLRRYKSPDGKWVYIYHEGEAHGRVIPEEAHEMIKKLADLGDEHAQHLVMSLEDHSKEKLDALRELGDLGDHDAVHHLKRLGIDHADDKQKRHAAEIERQLFEERNRNPLVKPLEGAELSTMRDKIKGAVDRTIFTYLRGHVGTGPERALREAGVTLDTVMQPVMAETTVIGALKKLHESLKAVERAHTGVSSSNTGASSVGGYANQAWNSVLGDLRDSHMIPETMHAEQLAGISGRAPGRQIDSMDPARHAAAARQLDERRKEAAKRAERERAERQAREEREARERAEREARERQEQAGALARHQDSINDMVSYFGASISPSEHPNMAKNIQAWFGNDFTFKGFIKHLNPGRDEKTEIRIDSGILNEMRTRNAPGANNRDFGANFTILEKAAKTKAELEAEGWMVSGDRAERTVNGRRRSIYLHRTADGKFQRQLTSASRTVIKNSDGSIHWANGSFSRGSNEDLKKFPGMARGLYMGVERFLKDVTANWTGAAKENTKVTIGTCANGGFGDGYKGALVWAKHCFDWSGGNVSNAASWKRTWNSSIDSFARQVNIPSDQVRLLKEKVAAAEYPHQFVNTGFTVTKAQAEAMVGRSMDFDFNQIFEKKGYCDIGDLIMIDSGISWSAENYVNRTTGRAGALNAVRTAYYNNTVPPATPTRITTGSSAPASASGTSPYGELVDRTGGHAIYRRQTASGGQYDVRDASGVVLSTHGTSSDARDQIDRLTRSAPAPTYSSSWVASRMGDWPRRNATGQYRIALSSKRFQRLLNRTDAEVNEFLRAAHGHLSPAAIRRVKKAMRDAGRSAP